MHEGEPKFESSDELYDSPSPDIIAQACAEVLPEEELAAIRTMEHQEAIDYLFAALPVYGVEDAEGYLEAVGLVQGTNPDGPDDPGTPS